MRSRRADFRINFSTFEGPGPFLKTVVSCTRNTVFEGWWGPPCRLVAFFLAHFLGRGFWGDIFLLFVRIFPIDPPIDPPNDPPNAPPKRSKKRTHDF